MAPNPLAEVFGFPPGDFSDRAARYREKKLCPYNNKVPNCTKDKANDPLGVCSIHAGGTPAITCPIRFRQDWLIADHAAAFFFPEHAEWTSLTEVELPQGSGASAGNIDLVLVSYDESGKVTDFGSVEIQAVYISGNVRKPFEHYMEDPAMRHNMEWKDRYYPKPDYLSSSRKRLVPQLIFKGSILRGWGKKQAVVLHKTFYETLPVMGGVEPADAEMAWLVYDLERVADGLYSLKLERTVYTLFKQELDRITTPVPGDLDAFLDSLQAKLDTKLNGEQNPPDAPTLFDLADF